MHRLVNPHFYSLHLVTLTCFAELDNESQPRRSLRVGRGNGGRIQQLQNIERVQTASHSRPSTRHLDMATQGQQVNPMSPSYDDYDQTPYDDHNQAEASDDNYDQESQIPPWAQSSLESQVHPQPLVKYSRPGDKFGFRVPSANGTQSTTSLLSSRSLSTSSVARSHGGSTAPTSHPPSECGSYGAYGGQGNMGSSQLAPARRSSQLLSFAAARQPAEVPQRSSRVRPFSDDPVSGNSIQDQPLSRENDSPSPPPRPVGLRRTCSFAQLPSTVPPSHTMFATDAEHGIDPDAIDEVSPSEDERFAEAMLRGDSTCGLFQY